MIVEILRFHPYRLFFPLGILFALIGVGEWMFFSLGWTIPAASFMHASLQAQGFLTCFVVGFLLTAFPRFTGTNPAEIWEIGAAFCLALALLVALIAKWFWGAQLLFGGLIITLLLFGAQRLPQRNKTLPPSFLLMGFGFLHALTGTVLMLMSDMGSENIAQFTIGRQMIQVGFLLCMVLGITGQLAPFLMGYTGEPESDEVTPVSIRSGPQAMIAHGVAGALLYMSFWLIPTHERLAYALRAAVATLHFLFYARIGREVIKKTALIYSFTLSMWMIPIGLWSAALFPVYRIAALHLVFIGGFSLMIFSFGQLIVLTHTGYANLLNGRLIPLKIVAGSVFAAMILRVSADVFAGAYMPLIHMASGLWVLAAAFWIINLFPKMYGRRA